MTDAKESPPFATQTEALMDALENAIGEGGGLVVVCIGDECPLSAEERDSHMDDCPVCRRIKVDADGNTEERRRKAN